MTSFTRCDHRHCAGKLQGMLPTSPIDESMISYKGRLSFVQYLPKKPHKWRPNAWFELTPKMGTAGGGNFTQARRVTGASMD